MKRLLLIAVLLMPLAAMAQNDDKTGVWIELGTTKKLSKRWSVGAGVELRAADDLGNGTRVSAGATVAYKPLSWMRLAAGYEWLNGYTPETTKPDPNSEGVWNGFNYKQSASYWMPRHRLKAEVALQLPKLWHCLRVSLRERYQISWRRAFTVERMAYKFYSKDKAAKPAVDKDEYYELTDDGDIVYHPAEHRDAEPGHSAGDPKPGSPEYDPKEKAATRTQYLRSRLKVEYERRRCPWSPFVAYEVFNLTDAGFDVAKTRFSAGLGYKIDKRNEVEVAYLVNTDLTEAGHPQTHVINMSYSIKF